MEVLIICILVLVAFIIAIQDSGSQKTPPVYPSTPVPKAIKSELLVATLKMTSIESPSGEQRKGLQVSFKGTFAVPQPGFKLKWGMELVDVADGARRPIASLHPLFTKGDSPWVAWEADDYSVIPYKDARLAEAIQLPIIPLSLLAPPESGARPVQATVIGTTVSGARLITINSNVFHVLFELAGYEEVAAQAKDEREEGEEIAVELAIAVCAADGDIDKRERALVRDFCKREIELYREDYQADAKRRLNNALRRAVSKPRLQKNVANITPLAERLSELLDEGKKMSVMSLCVEIAGADSIIQRSEARILEEIRKALEISPDDYRDLCGRNLGADIEAGADVLASLLGVRKSTPRKDALEIIMRETAKWLEMQGSSDPEKRKKAERMLLQLSEIKRRVRA